MNTLETVDTDRCAVAKQAIVWQTWISRYLARMSLDLEAQERTEFTPLGHGRFHGRIDHGELGVLYICRMTAGPHSFSRGVNPSWSMRRRSWLLILQVSGVSRYEHDGEERVVMPDQMHLLDSAEPFAVSSPKGCEQIIIMLPDGVSPPTLERMSFSQNSMFGPPSMLGRIVRNACDCYDQIDPDSARHISLSILHLLSNMCRGSAPSNSPADIPGRAKYARVASFLEAHLADERLSPQMISDALGCSVRTLHRMFQLQWGVTFGTYLWQRRLERCIADLRDPGQAMRSITDIAYSWGFNSSAHFSRLFKATVGQSPRAYREISQRRAV